MDNLPLEYWCDPTVARDPVIGHGVWIDYLVELCDKPGAEVLELGSRTQTGAVYRNCFREAKYIGFDIYPGENVDV